MVKITQNIVTEPLFALSQKHETKIVVLFVQI